MPTDRHTATLPPALVVCVLVVAGLVSTPGVAGAEFLTATASQDPAAGEASLDLEPPTRRLIQQGLRNEGFDPGTPDGLFGTRTRAAIRDWQRSRGASPTGYLNGAEAELLRTTAAPPAAVPGASPPPQPAAAVDLSAVSAAAPPASPAEADSNPPPAPVADPVGPQSVAATNTEPSSRPAPGIRNVQLPPEILVDRHLVRADRLLAADDPAAALEAMNEVLALQEEHSLVLEDDFYFHYARVAFAAGRTERAIASLNEYLAAGGRAGEFYREALELLDAAEVRLEREAADRREAEAERRRAEAERRRATRWPPGHVFRDCETCPEMVVLPGSVVALGRYEVTLGEYRAFASTTGGGAGGGCDDGSSFTDEDPAQSWRNLGFLVPQTDRHPVTCMSWDDAQAYVSWLSRTTETAYRLPSLEELIRASARSQRGCHDRNTAAKRREGTCPVGTNGTNSLGLSDLLGNVREWTSRCWRGNCGQRLIHGGGWSSYANNHFGSFYASTDHRRDDFGFRVARPLE